jgi:flagellar biogenesis protein FliO
MKGMKSEATKREIVAGKVTPMPTLPPGFGPLARAWWRRILGLARRSPRRLRLLENLPLGERRFVAVIEFDESRFLVGGTSASLVLLARLDNDGAESRSPLARETTATLAKEQP